MVANRLAHRMQVHFPPDVRTRKQQLAGVGPVGIETLPDGPLHQQARAGHPTGGGVIARCHIRIGPTSRFLLHQPCQHVMHDLAPGRTPRPHLDGAHPPRLRDAHFRERLEPHVLAMRRHRIGLGFENQVRLTIQLGQLPAFAGRPLLRRRHVLGIAQRRAGVDPADNGRYLCVRQ